MSDNLEQAVAALVTYQYGPLGPHIRAVLAALAQAQAAVRECEAEHPPEPEYVAWCEAGKPDGLALKKAQEQLRAAEARLSEALNSGDGVYRP